MQLDIYAARPILQPGKLSECKIPSWLYSLTIKYLSHSEIHNTLYEKEFLQTLLGT